MCIRDRYYSYALQYYKNSKNEIQWLPICGIPQTIIANKTLFEPVSYTHLTAETKGIIYDKFCIVTDAQSDIERMYREFEQEFDIMDRRGGVYELSLIHI